MAAQATKPKQCDECGCNESMMPGSIKDRIWEQQVNEHREIIINGVIDDKVIERVVIQIHNINRHDDSTEAAFNRHDLAGFKREPITIFINSTGGSVDCAFAVVSAITSSNTPVITVALGAAMSGGFLILLAGDQRYAAPYADLMYHELSSLTGGKASEVIEYGDYLDQLQCKITDFVVQRSSIPESDLDDCHARKVDWYMDTCEALAYGVIDGIWPPDVYSVEGVKEKYNNVAQLPEEEPSCGKESCVGCNDCE